ncbi:hypothetical protein [Streptomyces fodineus]|uniref:hypothetical protein n=1 Tax=Streptomyces fodineus TaxID=1904616 RepID=UPI001D03DEE4|nr:hypothetical protein [Streptomyces fodineus]
MRGPGRHGGEFSSASGDTICRAFHWLDQTAVLARLDDQVAPDGVVAIFGDRLPEFETAVKERLADFSEDDTCPEENEFLIRFGRRSGR